MLQPSSTAPPSASATATASASPYSSATASIGNLLLAVAEEYGEPIAVAVALALGGAVLLGCTIASHRRGRQQPSAH